MLFLFVPLPFCLTVQIDSHISAHLAQITDAKDFSLRCPFHKDRFQHPRFTGRKLRPGEAEHRA